MGDLGKYFLHGGLFSVILLVFWSFIGSIIAAVLTLGFAFVGLIIALIFLFLVMGGINAFLYDFIWDVSIQLDIISLIGHGLLLFVLLLVAYSPIAVLSFYLSSTVPSLVILIVAFIPYCLISGFVAKKVGQRWEE